jgi:signal transduction histidine kinase
MVKRGTTWIIAMFLFLAPLASMSAEPARVLLLDSFGPHFSPYVTLIANLRTDLAQQSSEPIDFYEVSLSTARFVEGEREEALVEYLDSLFAGRRLDLVVTIGAPAAGFLQRNRKRVFPSSPALFTAVDQRRLEDAALTANDVVVAVKIDLPPLIENILDVLPQTTRVAVVIGNSPLEKFWLKAMRQEFQQFSGRVEFTWFNELSFDDMLKRAATLPSRSAIFFADLTIDATGVPHEEEKALMDIHAVANAPIFSYVDNHFGRGIVGGRLISLGELSRQAAGVAARILRGETPAGIGTPPIGLGAPVFDWRELRRWNIDESGLPAGSSIQFREPTMWDQYRSYMLLTAVFCALQAGFIVVLLVNGQRLRRAHTELRRTEQEAHVLSGQLIKAQEEERSRLARELHDDVTQRLALLAIDAGREEQSARGFAGNTAMRAMREGLVRLSEDVHALSYRLHPSILEDLGLIEALNSECERFSRRYPIQLKTSASANDIPKRLPREAALCLFRIAQEGLRNIARHARAKRAEVRLRSLDNGLKLIISDDGVGFDPARGRQRMSLGHASMRQRVLLLGGKIEIDSGPGQGTTIEAWIPLKEEEEGYEPSARAAGR